MGPFFGRTLAKSAKMRKVPKWGQNGPLLVSKREKFS